MSFDRYVMLAVLCLLLASCATRHDERLTHVAGSSEGSPSGEAPVELRSYPLPKGMSRPVQNTLARLLHGQSDSEKSIGRVSLSPDGRLVVVAPVGVQAGVKKLVEQLKKSPAPSPSTIRMQYWIVLGAPGEATEIPDKLGELEGALEEVARADGPLRFSLLEELEVLSLSDERAETEGNVVELGQTVSERDGAILADLEINPRGPATIRTQVAIDPGQTVVLGQGGFHPRFLSDASAELDREEVANTMTLYYVVRATMGRSGGEAG